MSAARRFSERLERRAAWRFAATSAACMSVAVLILGGITQWLIKGHLDLAYLLVCSGMLAVGTSAGAAFTRRQRRSGQ